MLAALPYRRIIMSTPNADAWELVTHPASLSLSLAAAGH
jgi:hypothetical protein